MFTRYVAETVDASGIDPRVVAYYAPGSLIVEQYRNIKTYISSLNGGDLFRSIMVTSPNRREGKSLTSVNLAVAMAEDKDKTVILADLNFRAPEVSNLLNVKAPKGLSDYFNNDVRLDEILTKTSINNLMMLSSGNMPSNPAGFFTYQKIKELITELEKHFNYIILDTPALIPFADARTFAPAVDGVILAVCAGKTRREVVWRAQEQIKSVRGKLIGVVLTQVEYYIPEYIHRHL